jgi:hypothetical protein
LTQTTTFTVNGTDANGCSNSDQITVNVSSAPTVTLGNDIEVCENEAPVQVSASSNQGGLVYFWNTGDNTSAISTSTSGEYYVTVTDANGCSDMDTISVTLNELPGANLGTDQSICSNDLPTTLSVQSTGNQLSYLWSTGQTTQQIQVSQAGSYSASVIDTNGCESSDVVQVQVLIAPNVNAGNDITVCEYNFPVTLNATGNGAEVEWSNGAATPLTNVTAGGTYSVTTTAQNGCQATDTVVVTSDPCLGVNEMNSTISIYPNPTNSTVVIQLDYAMDFTYKIFNTEGKLLLNGKVDSNEISLHELAKGAYIIHICNAEKSYISRIIKQ